MKQDRDEALTLELLQAIDARSDVTQRHLADRMGIALGLANSYLRRCVRKGLVKIKQAPANRYLYYLTPSGFSEKSRLTAEYFSSSFSFYRTASDSIVRALRDRSRPAGARIIFCGVSELAEIGSIRVLDFRLDVLGTFDSQSQLEHFIGRPVWHVVSDVPEFDIAIFTALVHAPAQYDELIRNYGSERVVVPDVILPLIATPQDG